MEKVIYRDARGLKLDGDHHIPILREIVWSDNNLIERVTEGGEVTETIIRDPKKLAIEQQAETDAKNIPGWATWDMAQAVDYIQANVKDLASAKNVLIAMAKMLVVLRDKAFPKLGE